MSDLPPIRVTKSAVVPAEQDVPVQTEEERRQQEAEEFLRDHPPKRRQMTEEEIEAVRLETLAGIPHAMGRPVPETTGITEEQLRNNPSNYQPSIDASLEALTPTVAFDPIPTANPSVLQEAAKPAVKAKPVATDERQQWVCVQGDGIRTVTDKVPHPVFGSDAHLMDRLVTCPTCGSISVRKLLPGETPDNIVPHP